MVLGNTNGANKGKRYFSRKRDLPTLEALYEKEASEFALWFSDNHQILKHKIEAKKIYDDDIFNETYLRLHEIILYTGRKIKCFTAYFIRAFFTNKIQIGMAENRYVSMFEGFDYNNSESDEDLQTKIASDENASNLHSEMLDYAKLNFPEDYILFEMNMVDAMSYQKIAKATGIKTSVIQRKVSPIKKELKEIFLPKYQLQNTIDMETKLKTCGKCNTEKPTSEFHKNVTSKDGLQCYCKDCKKQSYKISSKVKATPAQNQPRKERPIKVEMNGLSSFSPEELMKELYQRGYQGVLTYTARIDIAQL